MFKRGGTPSLLHCQNNKPGREYANKNIERILIHNSTSRRTVDINSLGVNSGFHGHGPCDGNVCCAEVKKNAKHRKVCSSVLKHVTRLRAKEYAFSA